ncbi:MAG: glycosyltransferase, partial [Chloroflexota bacterium]|nr:glycosyltransferase [Chloroflexota bacterium]
MISVIIPAKDASDTIGPCLNGVLAQQDVGVDYEVILVDDGSSDETAAIGITKGVKVIQQECAGPAA